MLEANEVIFCMQSDRKFEAFKLIFLNVPQVNLSNPQHAHYLNATEISILPY